MNIWGAPDVFHETGKSVKNPDIKTYYVSMVCDY